MGEFGLTKEAALAYSRIGKRVAIVYLKIINATNLIKKDIFTISDPFVKITLINREPNDDGNVVPIDVQKTSTRKKTLNPEWNEEFYFRVLPDEQVMTLDIFDENRYSKHDFRGQCAIDLRDIDMGGEVQMRSEKLVPKPNTRARVRGVLRFLISLKQFDESADISDETAAPSTTTTTTTAGMDQNRRSAPLPPLPSGWEERKDANDRTYYVDHTTRTTTWHRPQSQPATSTTTEGGTTTNPYPRRSMINQSNINRYHVNDEQDNPPTISNVNSNSDSIPSAEEWPLPHGWDMSKTQNGRVFFINHSDKTTSWIDPRTNKESPNNPIDSESYPDALLNLGPLPPNWERKRHVNGRFFFVDHENKKTQWEDPRIEKISGPKIQQSSTFRLQYNQLRQKLPVPTALSNKFEIKVYRSSILETSFTIIETATPERLRARLWVDFIGEKGLDYGGLTREWFLLLSKELFNPYYGLFEYAASDNYTLQINPLSGVLNEHHLRYFHFAGRIAAMAVYHNRLLDVYFIRPFYKMMLNSPITLEDMEQVDENYFKSLTWLLETDLMNEDECLDEYYFTIETEVFGEIKEVELKEDGKNIRVTNQNKEEYIDLLIQFRFKSRIRTQMDKFKEGFNEIVPLDLLKQCGMTSTEIELLISGIGTIDVHDWMNNTEYKGYTYNDRVISVFWKVVLSFDNSMRLKLLQFVTGTTRLPRNGFSELFGSNGPQRFKIEKWGTEDKLPRSHTCFNRLDLPPYPNYEIMRQKILTAIQNSDGYGGVD
ncbi:hypothetical protein SNEBB_008586 [Seison nebaliae]|nr:hypothetical protein SNEBB_008586 [Seison nebaliae]